MSGTACGNASECVVPYLTRFVDVNPRSDLNNSKNGLFGSGHCVLKAIAQGSDIRTGFAIKL